MTGRFAGRVAVVTGGMGGLGESISTKMAEAGYKDGIDLTIGGYTDQDSVRRGEVIQDQLGKVGIKLKFTRGTIAEISAQFFAQEKKFDMLVSAWTGRPDPSMTYGLGFDKGAYYNAGRTADPELSKLIQESRASQDLNERAAVFAKIQRFTVEQALAVLHRYDDYKVNLWCFDTRTYAHAEFDPTNGHEINDYKAPGGGGTDFRPAFKWADDNGISPQYITCTYKFSSRLPTSNEPAR